MKTILPLFKLSHGKSGLRCFQASVSGLHVREAVPFTTMSKMTTCE